MYTYLVCDTRDIFLLPVGVFDSLRSCSAFLGCTPEWLSSLLSRFTSPVIGDFRIYRFLNKELDKIS